MGYELQRLSARHKRIVSLVLEGRFNNKQIAQIMGMTPEAISYILQCGLFQDEVARRRAAMERSENENIGNNLSLAREFVEREAVPSVLKLAEIRDSSPDQNLQRTASTDILKLAFGREQAQGGAIGQVVVMNAEKVAFLVQAAKEAGLQDELNLPADGEATQPAGTASGEAAG